MSIDAAAAEAERAAAVCLQNHMHTTHVQKFAAQEVIGNLGLCRAFLERILAVRGGRGTAASAAIRRTAL